MLRTRLAAVAATAILTTSVIAQQSWIDPYREPAARIIGESLATRFAWERLAFIGDTFGSVRFTAGRG